jgi:hypothetical protein
MSNPVLSRDDVQYVFDLCKELRIDYYDFIRTNTNPLRVLRIQKTLFGAYFVLPNQCSPEEMHYQSQARLESGLVRRAKPMEFGNRPGDVLGREGMLHLALGESTGLSTETRYRFSHSMQWYLMQFLVADNQPRAEPIGMDGDCRTFNTWHYNMRGQFGTVDTRYQAKHALRALAACIKTCFRTYGHILCHVCRQRRSLKHFAQDKGFWVWACRWCNENTTCREAPTTNVLKSRVCIALRQEDCHGHPICGTCFLRSGIDRIDERGRAFHLSHNTGFQRFVDGSLDPELQIDLQR